MCKKIITMFLVLSALTGCQKKEEPLTISVAASLVDPINEIVEIYEKENNKEINVNSGSSGTLKKQIENGANVDVFFSANEKYTDDLVKSNFIKKENVTYPVCNSLVLIKNNNSKNISSLEDLKSMSISLGEISTVPVGQYAKEALTNLGVFDEIKENIIYGKDVTTVKSYVESGNCDLGVVYKSDSINLENSSVIYEFPSETHTKIRYSLSPIKTNEDTEKLINLINSDEGKEIFKNYGFSIENDN